MTKKKIAVYLNEEDQRILKELLIFRINNNSSKSYSDIFSHALRNYYNNLLNKE